MNKLSLLRRSIGSYRQKSMDVMLAHTEVEQTYGTPKPMIVLHGILGNKSNLRGIVSQQAIRDRRWSFLVDMRNHYESDWHNDMNYHALSDDVIRFADERYIDTFTMMGHSMGGRSAMYVACRYPDRVNGLIVIDTAPVDESAKSDEFNKDVISILKFITSSWEV